MDLDKLKNCELFLFDMDGTLYLGDDVYDGAIALMEDLPRLGKKYIYLTNNSSRAGVDYITRLRRLGFPCEAENVFTSGLFYLTYRFYGKKNGVSPEMWGIKISLRDFLKTLLLAVCVFTAFYGLVAFADYFFLTDYRIWTLDIRAFQADKLKIAIQYWPLFFIFYAANSISINSGNRVAGMSEKFNIFMLALGNSLGVIILNLIQYGTVFTTGVPHWQADWLRPLVIVPLIVQLFVAAYISRGLFKKTGKVWLGAMVNTLIIVMMGVANTASFTVL